MLRYPRLTVFIAVLATVAAAVLAVDQLRLNTDTAALLSPDLPFRRAQQSFQEQFPSRIDVFVAVVDGTTPEQAEDAARTLAGALARDVELFSEVQVEGAEPYFQRNALLFLDAGELRDIADRLIAGQAIVGLLGRDPSLAGLAEGVQRILEQARPQDFREADRLLAALIPALADPPATVSWQTILGADPRAAMSARRLVLIKPRLDFSALLPAGPAMGALQEAIKSAEAAHGPGVRIRVTGDAALSHEEMDAAMSGALATGSMALATVTALLLVGLGSAWLALACLATLLMGLALTAGFAALAVGELNLISIAFAALYIGLAVDYSIHFCMSYREQLRSCQARRDALGSTLLELRRPLSLCTLTTAIGFFAFLPTSFRGVAELGLIAGAGMVINLLLTWLVLPPLLLQLPAPGAWQSPFRLRSPPRLPGITVTVAVAALLTLVAALLLPSLEFDRNPLNLRDPAAESVATLRDLLADPKQQVAGATVLAPDAVAAGTLAAQLRALPQVGEVWTLASVIPEADAEKLALIDELSLMLGLPDKAATAGGPPRPAAALPALIRLQHSAHAYAERSANAAATIFAERINLFLHRLRSSSESQQASELASMERRLTATLPRAIERLRDALSPDRDPGLTVPDSVRRQWIGTNGQHRISVLPHAPLTDDGKLRAFVESVQAVAPTATDEPVLNLRAGDEVVRAFRLAFTLAAGLITAVLILLLRNWRQILTTLLPVTGAAALAGGSMAALEVPLNFANIIALPLLFGIGVDNGVHVVQRSLRDPGFGEAPYASATTRAIVLSGATTLAGFGNLMLAPHPGLASMGIVLTIGIAWILAITLLVVPPVLYASSLTRA